MKKGTIFKNLWAGYETYFVYHGPGRSRKWEDDLSSGYGLSYFQGEWHLKKAQYYTRDLKDAEHFPIVGQVDIDSVIKNTILDAIGVG